MYVTAALDKIIILLQKSSDEETAFQEPFEAEMVYSGPITRGRPRGRPPGRATAASGTRGGAKGTGGVITGRVGKRGRGKGKAIADADVQRIRGLQADRRKKAEGCKNTVLVGQNVRKAVKCVECCKPRCVYSKGKLTTRDTMDLQHLLERHDYTCGSLITPDGDSLQGNVFVRVQLTCNSPVEYSYYSSAVGRPDICCYCVASDVLKDKDLQAKYRVVLPVCENCVAAKLPIPKRNPIKK